MKSIVGFAALPLLAAASPVFNIGTIHKDSAPILSASNAKEVPDSYIVVFKDHVSHEAASAHHSWVQNIHVESQDTKMDLKKRSQFPFLDQVFEGLKHTYKMGDFLGYSGHFDDSVIEQIRQHPDVEYIEKDSIVHTMKDDVPTTEKNAPWGLARISHRKSLGFGNFNKYLYAEDGGEGVDVYVIDTGTYVDHVDFEGRASWAKTIPTGASDEDGNGHGTHCSGTAVGKKYGVAKKAHVHGIKVLGDNGSGTMSDVVKGVEYAAQLHDESIQAAKKGKKKGFKGSTANMSLGGGKSPTLERAVNAAVEVGIHFAVAAGNDNGDSCNSSPASAENPITVGASNFEDERAYFSNYGPCNDIFAPGLNILSTWIGSKYAVNTISGTSMASPHIAGLLAYMLSLQPAKDSSYAVADIKPKKLKANLISIGTKNALKDVPTNTANILAWNGGGLSNYSEIIKAGGYTVGSASTDTSSFGQKLEELEAEAKSAGKDLKVEAASTLSELSELEKAIHAKLETAKQQLGELLE